MNRIYHRFHAVLMFALIISLLAQPSFKAQAQSSAPNAFITCASIIGITPTECDALVALYNGTGGTNWTTQTNWLATDTPADWFGVTTDPINGHLTRLELPFNNLSGELPSSITNLASINVLYLSGNQLSGTVPNLGSLTNLSHLLLSTNQFSSFDQTMFSSLTNLVWLDLSGNSFSGPYPEMINTALTSLERLNLSNNQFSGPIPDSFGNLVNLTRLELGENQFSGTIPLSLNPSTLRILNLEDNLLTGGIPSFIKDLVNLTHLSLSNNPLGGTIPDLSNLNALENLALSNNQLSGQFPTLPATTTKLLVLDLSNNSFEGPIPDSLATYTHLTGLSLQQNYFTGSIPTVIGNLTNLNILSLANNLFSGSIPAGIGSIAPLVSLNLSTNQLSGGIPGELGNLVNLENLDLSYNNFTGSIPGTFGSLSALKFLYLNNNALSGLIPAELGNLTLLTRLYLQYNQLGDNIPGTADIPAEIGNLPALQQLDFSHNQLTGEIPAILWNLPNIDILDLSTNLLTGSIPEGFTGLRSATRLLVSHNRLTGLIQPVLGSLSSLAYLDLSDNQFTGALPGELGTLSNLTHLFLNKNTGLTGPIPLSFINLANLYRIDFSATSLCEPLSPEYFAWKATIPSYTGTIICGYPGGIGVAGKISEKNNSPLQGVTLQAYLDGDLVATVTSDSNGLYQFNFKKPGTYWVRPSMPGHQFYPRELKVQVWRGRTGQNFLQRPVTCFVPNSSTRQPCDVLTTTPFLLMPVASGNIAAALQDIDFQDGQVASWFDHSVSTGSSNTSGLFYDGESYSANLINRWITCFDRHCADSAMGLNFSPPQGSVDKYVHPAAAGRVIEVCRRATNEVCARDPSLGRYVLILHSGTPYATLYAHLAAISSSSSIDPGKMVQPSTVIGTLGGSGGQPLNENYWPKLLHFKVFFNGSGATNWTPNSAEVVDPFGWQPYNVRDDDGWNTPSIPLWSGLEPELSEAPDIDGSEISTNGVSLRLPANDLTTGQIITLANASPGTHLTDNLRAVWRSFQVKIINSNSQWSLVNNLLHPIEVMVNYTPANLAHVDPSKISLYRQNPQTLDWNPITTTVSDFTAAAGIQSSGTYALAAPLICAQDHWEPYDDSADLLKHANPWRFGVALDRMFDFSTDQDWIPVELLAGVKNIFKTEHPSTGIDSILTLVAPDGKTVLITDGKTGGAAYSQIEWTAVTSGTYFLRVSQTAGSSANCSAYQITRVDDRKYIFLPVISR